MIIEVGGLAVAAGALVSGICMLWWMRGRGDDRPGSPATAIGFIVFGGTLGAGVGVLLTGNLAAEQVGWLLIAAAFGGVATLTLANYPRPDLSLPSRIAMALLVVAAVAVLIGTWWMPLLWSGAVIAGTVMIALVWWRTERSVGRERRCMLWLLTVSATAALFLGHLFFFADSADGDVYVVLAAVIAPTVPLLLALGMTVPDVVDIRLVISWIVLYLAMFELTVAVFSAASVVIANFSGTSTARATGALIAFVGAAAFGPVASRLRGVVDEVLFGSRGDAVLTLSGLGQKLSAAGGPENWVLSLRDAIGVPRIELWDNEHCIATAGEGGADELVVKLTADGEEVGKLVVGVPADSQGLHPQVRSVLQLVAAPMARALQGVSLAADLRESRGHVLTALEEERRRLRRDLHDSLGPILTGVAFTTDAARNHAARDPAETVRLLDTVRAETAGAIVEIRRLVEGLRPPALDEMGLVGAVKQRVSQLRTADGDLLEVSVTAPERLPPLPAAVEVAAFRIIVEAVTNVARHSGSASAAVDLDVADRNFTITVRDIGSNAADWTPGTGLQSIRERSEQLGGSVLFTSGRDGGLVSVNIPFA
ncbi:UNVERIFIED_CONTAM: histidine kinase [Williamsia faeni]